MANRGHATFSVFGQIEQVAAEIMIRDGEASRIQAAHIPPEMAVNEFGEPAKFAIAICGREKIAKFEQLIRDLRA